MGYFIIPPPPRGITVRDVVDAALRKFPAPEGQEVAYKVDGAKKLVWLSCAPMEPICFTFAELGFTETTAAP